MVTGKQWRPRSDATECGVWSRSPLFANSSSSFFLGIYKSHSLTYLNWKLDASNIYRIYPKYSDTSTPYHICSNIWTSTIYYPMLCLKIAGWVANSVDPDETPHSAASHLGRNCLLRPVCPNTYGKYGSVGEFIQSTNQQQDKTQQKLQISTLFNQKVLIFFLYLQETYVVGIHQKRIAKALLMNIHNICLCGEIRKM